MKKMIYLTLVFGMMSTIVVTSALAEKTTVTYWNGFTGPDRPTNEALINKFNETHPDIKIKVDIMSWGVFYPKLLSAMAARKGPDIAGLQSEFMPQYAEAGVLLPVDDFYTEKIEKKVFVPALMENLESGGKMYGVPVNFCTLMLFYNKDIIKEAGLDPETPPTNWDEWQPWLLETMKVTKYGMAIPLRETIYIWPILIWGNGGEFISEDRSEVLINSKKVVEAVKYWADLIIKHGISGIGLTGAEAGKLATSAIAAMEINGPWEVPAWIESGLNFDVTQVPRGPEKKVTLGYAHTMVFNKTSANKKEAVYEFFRWWNSRDSQVFQSLGVGFPPARLDIVDDPRLEENPFIKKFALAAPYAKFYLSGIPQFSEIEKNVVVPALESILYERKTVEEALNEAATEIEKILKIK